MWTLIWCPERWVRMSFQEFVLEFSLARNSIDPTNSVSVNYGYVYSSENITAGWLSVILHEILPLLASYWAFPSPLDMGYRFLLWPNILLSMVVQQWVAILVFSQEKMSAHPSTQPSYFLLYSSSVYSPHLFLISPASVRSIPFLSFIVLIFAWNIP